MHVSNIGWALLGICLIMVVVMVIAVGFGSSV